MKRSQVPAGRPARRAGRPILAAVLLAGALLAVPLSAEDPLVRPAQALFHDCLSPIFNCDVEVELTGWNETGPPGAILQGTITVKNTGNVDDTYTIGIKAANETWEANVDPSEVEVEAEESAQVAIRVRIPEDAHLDDSTTITVNATSGHDDEIMDEVTFDARTGQVFEWAIACTPEEIEIVKGRSGNILLVVQNLGNGPDQATVTTPPLPEGINIPELDTFDLESGAIEERNVTIEIGIGLEEGDYTIHWDLASMNVMEGASYTPARCTTTLIATVNGDNGDGDGEEEDSPLPAALVLVAILGAALIARRRGRQA